MKRSSDLKADIEKIKKLKALQQQATDKLDKLTDKSAAKATPKKKAALKNPAIKRKLSAVKRKPAAVKRKPAAVKRKTAAVNRKTTTKHKAKATEKKSYFWKMLFGNKSNPNKSGKAKEVGQRS